MNIIEKSIFGFVFLHLWISASDGSKFDTTGKVRKRKVVGKSKKFSKLDGSAHFAMSSHIYQSKVESRLSTFPAFVGHSSEREGKESMHSIH